MSLTIIVLLMTIVWCLLDRFGSVTCLILFVLTRCLWTVVRSLCATMSLCELSLVSIRFSVCVAFEELTVLC